MSGYKKGSEVLKEWGILEIDLLELVQKGLQPLNQNGFPIPPPEISRKREKVKELRAQYEKLVDKTLLYKKADLAQARIIRPRKFVSQNRPDIKILRESIQKYENELAPFEKNEWGPFQFKTDKQVSEAYSDLMKSLFKKEDLEKFLPTKKKQTSGERVDVTERTNLNDFIRNTKISYKSASEIVIHVPGRAPATHDFKVLGFRSDQNEGWKDLINILEISLFSVGKYNRHGDNHKYDRRQKRLHFINQKLIAFFNQQYELNISSDFKFFSLFPDDSEGIYRPVFKIKKNDIEEFEQECTKLSESELKSKLKALRSEFNKQQEGSPQQNRIVAKMRIIFAQGEKLGIARRILDEVRGSTSSDLKEVYASDRDRDISRYASEDAGE